LKIFSVNEKCTGCGACAAECPPRVIDFNGKGSVPSPAPDAPERCIRCGHCVAVCPAGALAHRDLKPEECLPLVKDLLISGDQAGQFLAFRRSIRAYQERPVEREVLHRLVSAARFAPTGHNKQQVHWLVFEKKGQVECLAGLVIDWLRILIKDMPEAAWNMRADLIVEQWENGLDRICRRAPHVIVAHAPANLPLIAEDCLGALAYLELAASALGLGSCWAGYLHLAAGMYPPLKEFLGLPEGHKHFGAVMLGYPKYRYHRIPLRKDPPITWR